MPVNQDRNVEDLKSISRVVKNLVGNNSLDDIINNNIPSLTTNVKGKLQSHILRLNNCV